MIPALKNKEDISLISLLWRTLSQGSVLKCESGRVAVLVKNGFVNKDNLKEFNNAVFVINGVSLSGRVVIGSEYVEQGEDIILQVVGNNASAHIFDCKGNAIERLNIDVEEKITEYYSSLVSGSRNFGCASFMASNQFITVSILSSLLYERLESKCQEVMQLHEQSRRNWNQTIHLMFFRAMGSPYNKVPFVDIATLVPYNIIAENKNSLLSLEALLYGTSGLLQLRRDRYGYIQKLRTEFDFLSHKYNIIPLKAGKWSLFSNGYKGKPEIRLMQVANFLHHKDFSFDSVLNIKDLEQVHKLFSCETSEFWRDIPSRSQALGKDRREVLAINLVVPTVFAYGITIDNQTIKEDSVELLYKIPAERNSIVAQWKSLGVELKTAADSQALLQLTKEYCFKQRCVECRFGKEQIKQIFAQNSK